MTISFSPMTVSDELQAEMFRVAKSRSLDQLKSFLQSHPETLNEEVSGYPPASGEIPLHRLVLFLGFLCADSEVVPFTTDCTSSYFPFFSPTFP